jgi:hypothetical protein
MPWAAAVPTSKPGRPLEKCPAIKIIRLIIGTCAHNAGSPGDRYECNEDRGHRADRRGRTCLAYGGFSFTKETHRAEIGPLKVAVQEKEQVNVPQWLGIGAIIAGVVLLVLPSKKG